MEALIRKYGWVMLIGLIILLNVIMDRSTTMFDLTKDNRYSFTDGTRELLESQKEPILAEILFEGNFPAGYKRLQLGVKDILGRMRGYFPRMRVVTQNPMAGEDAEVNLRMENFARIGLVPLPISYPGSQEFRAINSFPYVVFSQGQKQVIVPILEDIQVGNYNEEAINGALEKLEFKFANAIKKINQTNRRKIAFLYGNNIYNQYDLIGLEKELSRFFQIGRFALDTVEIIHPQIDVLIITTPARPYSDKELFAIDQYVMQGGNIIWLLDQYAVSLDSIRKNSEYIPINNLHGLENLLFKYGVRINNDLIADLSCSTIPMVVSSTGGKPQYEFFDWYYHAIPIVSKNEIINSGVSDMNMFFPSSIDTIKTSGQVEKRVLLSSSKTSKAQEMPRSLSFNFLRYPPEQSYFDQSDIPIAVIVEGSFQSFFDNRLTSEMGALLQKYQIPQRAFSEKSIQLVVSDGEFIRTNYAPDQNLTEFPVGYNYFENKLYSGNLEFMVNAVEYMTGGASLLPAKGKIINLRKLDEIKAQNESRKWQFINLLLPLLLLAVFGFFYNLWRLKRNR